MRRVDSNQDALRVRSNRDELIDRMTTAMRTDGTVEVFPGFRISRASNPSEPVRSVYEPSFCFVAQGSKQALLGGEIFRYDPRNYLIFTVDLPVAFQVEQASGKKPYLGFRLALDPALVASVVVDSEIHIKKSEASTKAMNVSSVDADLLDAVVRLVRLVETLSSGRFLLR